MFIIISFLLFYYSFSVKHFKAFNLLSNNNIILISNEGIEKYDPDSKERFKLVTDNNLISSGNEINLISFAQFPLEEDGYIFCRVKNKIYLLGNDLFNNGPFLMDELTDKKNALIIPYKNIEGVLRVIVAYINENIIKLSMFQMNIKTGLGGLLKEISHPIKNDLGNPAQIFNGVFSCSLMSSSEYDNKLLACFAPEQQFRSLWAIIINPEDNLAFVSFSNNKIETNGIGSIKSAVSSNNNKCLIAFVDYSKDFYSLTFDIEGKMFSEKNKLLSEINLYSEYAFDIKYIKEREEFYLYSIYDSNFVETIFLFFFDKNLNFKIKEGNEKCNISFVFSEPPIYELYSYYCLYLRYSDKYSVIRSYSINSQEKLDLVDSPEICSLETNPETENDYFSKTDKESNSDSQSLTTLLKTSILKYTTNLMIKTTLLKTVKELTTLVNLPSTSTISSIIKSGTIIQTFNLKTTLFNNYKSTIFFPTKSTEIIQSTSISSKEISEEVTTDKSSDTKLYSSIPTSNIFSNNEDYIEFFSDGDILKSNLTITKDELENKLDKILNQIEIGQKYEITGNGYNLTITPINELSNFKSTYVDFKECEEIIRNKSNISSDEILTFLQIEIDKMNEKALTSQVEYAVYNEKMEQLSLSECKNVDIKITYEITDDSILNKTIISYYDDLGIDLFNKNDSFFNDLCYSFSVSDSDIILKDRVSDIYQNYSLCDSGCEYDTIDLNNMSVTCTCKVKTEINTEIDNIYFGEMIQQTFKDSNIGVIRCYNLVFDFKNKMKNLGFIVFFIFVVAHIICFIIYFIKGINSIVMFVHREMTKNNYITIVKNPKKKNNIKKKSKKDKSIINNLNDQNSSILMNPKLEEKQLTNIKTKNRKILQKEKNKNDKKSKPGKKKDKIKDSKNPIFIFNYKYDNKFYNNDINSKNNLKSKKKNDIYNIKKKSNKVKKSKKAITKLNKEKNFPGYYNLIQINADNSSKNKPPESKYILNNYNYNQAIKYDTRDFWRIYYIILLSKENILNTFFFKTPLELFPIRLSLFIFTYSCDFALNALFYVNQKISDKYHYDGDSLYLYMFVNNLTITIFSTLSSYLLVKFLHLLTNSKNAIENLFKNEEEKMRKNKKYKVNSKSKKDMHNNLLKIYKTMKIKIICYIIIEFLVLLFFLYYVTAFCEVYKSTQKSWLYDSFISFLLSFLFEFLISFFISLLYISAIKIRINCLYNIILFLYRLG